MNEREQAIRKQPWELRDDPVAHLWTLVGDYGGPYADSLNALIARAARAEAERDELRATLGDFSDYDENLEAAVARAARAEAALRDIPPQDQLRLWLKEDLVALLDDLRDAGQEGKPGECVCGEINTRHCPVHAEARP